MEDETYRVLTGMKVVNHIGTFYFSEPGNWIDEDGTPTFKKLHRTDGPAAEWANGSKYWWVMGKEHRTDGPAVEFGDGYKFWFVNGEQLTEKQFNKRRKQNGR